jgi:hypothetical protein
MLKIPPKAFGKKVKNEPSLLSAPQGGFLFLFENILEEWEGVVE